MFDLDAEIKRALERQLREDSYYKDLKKGNYRSGALAGCPLQAALHVLGVEPSSVDMRYMAYGQAIHMMIQSILAGPISAGFAFAEYAADKMDWGKLGGDWNVTISSRTDILFRTREEEARLMLKKRVNGEVYAKGYEIKTLSPHVLKVPAYLNALPYPHHRRQHDIAAINYMKKHPEHVFSSEIVYIPREVVKTGAMQEKNSFIAARYAYTPWDIKGREPALRKYLADWEKVFVLAVEGARPGVVNAALDKFQGEYNIPNPKWGCANCDMVQACPWVGNGSAYAALARNKEAS